MAQASLMPHQEFLAMVESTVAKAPGIVRKHDKTAGIFELSLNDTICLTAIQKSRGGPWIVRFIDTADVKWYDRASIGQVSGENVPSNHQG